MPEHAPRRRLRPAQIAGVCIALLVIAAPLSSEARRLVMLGLLTVMWLSMIIADRIVQAQARSSGLRPSIALVGLGLVVLVSILMFDW